MSRLMQVMHWRPGVAFCLSLIVLLISVYLSFLILPNRIERLYAAQTKIKPSQPCVSADGFSPEMAVLPSGAFLMGSPANEESRAVNERQHEVELAAFAISRCEITFDQYQQYVNDINDSDVEVPFDVGWGRGTRPVINVSWNSAVDYTEWLSQKTGEEYRLPTEAEWEYAARAMQEGDAITPFNTGNCISVDQVNFDGSFQYAGCPTSSDSPNQTVAVGQYPPNQWGLYDMHGNVWEWTCSTYDEGYQGGEAVCAAVGDEGRRVLRGGSWNLGPHRLRSADRYFNVPTFRFYSVGFRVARAIR